MKNGRATSAVTLGADIVRMRQLFPSFRFERRGRRASWFGKLQPFPGCVSYRVRILPRHPRSPLVYVTSPALDRRAPHRYKGGELCLDYPKDRSWRPDLFTADTIVPWTAEWLLFYEYWLDTGKWAGPEAPHPAMRQKKC